MLVSICTTTNDDAPRILAVAPETPNLPNLRATDEDGELTAMRDDLKNILHVDALIGTVRLTGKGSLADALLDGSYRHVHLITHGTEKEVALTTERVGASQLARLLTQHGVEYVLAMTCDSYKFGKALAESGVRCVIAITGDLDNDIARAFSREFYMGLARGLSVAECVNLAKSRMPESDASNVHLLCNEAEDTLTQAEIASLRRKIDSISKRLDKLATSDEVHALTQAVISLAKVVSQ